MVRWLGYLGRYDLDIQYRPGKAHGNADALSRRPCGDCKHCKEQEERDQLEDPTDCPARICAVYSIQESEAPWLTSYSSEDLWKWQSEDRALSKLVKWLQQGERPAWEDVKQEGQLVRTNWSMWKSFHLNNGVIYRKDLNTEQIQIITPANLKQQILRQVHNHRLGGHFGIKKTLYNVRTRFWWPGLRADVKRWCRTCIACQKQNPRSARRIPLHQDLVGSPMERIAMDILSFREQTENGNTCILVITDYFTKWTEAFALPDRQAITVADTLVTQLFLKMGVPRILHLDQGKEFQSDLIHEICCLLEIQQTWMTPYRPQSDGQVERFDRTLILMLSKFCSENKCDWDDHLPYLMCAYRAMINGSSGCSPNLIMLGREITLPVNIMYPIPGQPKEYTCTTEYMEWLKHAKQDSFEEVSSIYRPQLADRRTIMTEEHKLEPSNQETGCSDFTRWRWARVNWIHNTLGPIWCWSSWEKQHTSFNADLTAGRLQFT